MSFSTRWDTAAVPNSGSSLSISPNSIQRDSMAKHMKPQNCENITVPRVNKGIWSGLPTKTRDNDLKLQHIQSIICKTFYPLNSHKQWWVSNLHNSQFLKLKLVFHKRKFTYLIMHGQFYGSVMFTK